MTEHILKCWPDEFQAIRAGRKPFEYRKNDRDYKVGDTLLLREFDPAGGFYTGAMGNHLCSRLGLRAPARLCTARHRTEPHRLWILT
ncbi:DUF3850 domain-containing protein [Rhizobium phaseoli]|uniref:DUF3850 domain-containing protein n=1 Tax=Rhizobium phaseoli TaxID=396 RepID=UPI0007E9BC3C|nr:ASC/PUA-like domain-containing protein [Rhizobium phaseoli]ANL99042.1 ASC/PUA-like domain-containing protein [Rhizobium phaseoli]